MKIFVIVGMPAAGKNIARLYADKEGISYIATGDIVRQEAIRRGISMSPTSMAALSDELREPDGLGVTRRALEEALTSDKDLVFMEGMRSWPEIELIREKSQCTVIAFVAPRNLRRERVMIRGRADDSPQAFNDRDWREIGYGAAVPIALADAYILNTSTIDHALKELDMIVQGL